MKDLKRITEKAGFDRGPTSGEKGENVRDRRRSKRLTAGSRQHPRTGVSKDGTSIPPPAEELIHVGVSFVVPGGASPL